MPQLTHEEIQAIWTALVEHIDNSATDEDGNPVGVEAAQSAHDKIEAFLVPLLERGRRASAELRAL